MTEKYYRFYLTDRSESLLNFCAWLLIISLFLGGTGVLFNISLLVWIAMCGIILLAILPHLTTRNRIKLEVSTMELPSLYLPNRTYFFGQWFEYKSRYTFYEKGKWKLWWKVKRGIYK